MMKMKKLDRILASKWMLPFLMEADKQHFEDKAWDELNWRGLLSLNEDPRQDEMVVVAAEVLGPKQVRIHGFAAWTPVYSTPGQMRLLKVAVQPSSRRQRVGMALVNLPWSKPMDIVTDVHERNLSAQKFFRGCGWTGLPKTRLDGNGLIEFRTDSKIEGPVEVGGGGLSSIKADLFEPKVESTRITKEKN